MKACLFNRLIFLTEFLNEIQELMKSFFASLKAFFCSHAFQTIHVYDSDTVKAYCPKCGNKFVVNERYKWKFKLNEVSERDYEDLWKRIQEFQRNYLEKGGGQSDDEPQR